MRLILLLISFLLSVAIKAQSNDLYFIPNVGQISTPESLNHTDEPIALCQLQTAVVYLRNNGIRINLTDPNDIPKIHKSFHFKGIDTSFTIKHHVVDILFKNALEPVKVEFLQPAPFYNNYYYGNNPDQWKTNVYPSKTIKLSNVYQNIDFLIYTTKDGIEFDWIVNPGGNPDDILLNFEGQNSVEINEKSIILHTTVGNFSIAPPKAFQTRKSLQTMK